MGCVVPEGMCSTDLCLFSVHVFTGGLCLESEHNGDKTTCPLLSWNGCSHLEKKLDKYLKRQVNVLRGVD